MSYDVGTDGATRALGNVVLLAAIDGTTNHAVAAGNSRDNGSGNTVVSLIVLGDSLIQFNDDLTAQGTGDIASFDTTNWKYLIVKLTATNLVGTTGTLTLQVKDADGTYPLVSQAILIPTGGLYYLSLGPGTTNNIVLPDTIVVAIVATGDYVFDGHCQIITKY